MGHKHTKEDILAGAVAVAFTDGLSQLTYGRVAKRLDISDRVIVYYFPTKDDLVSAVVLSMGGQLQATLGAAFAEPAEDHLGIVRAAWPVLASTEVDPVFALFFEANGLATAGREPYRTLVPQLVVGWIDWLEQVLVGDPDVRRAEAEAAVAIADGLLLVRQLAGPEAADRAARRLGVA
ncbi:MAG: TetR/AcrR family transcriptional regulator [Actinomycetota bacterium]